MLDATDALAVALCHQFTKGESKAAEELGLKSFIEENPGRVKK